MTGNKQNQVPQNDVLPWCIPPLLHSLINAHMSKAFCFLNASLHHYLTWKFSLPGWCLYRPADLQKWVKNSILAELHGSTSSITLISPKQSVLRLGGVGGIRREKKRTLPPDEDLTKVEIYCNYVSEKTARSPLATETSNKQNLAQQCWKPKFWALRLGGEGSL